MLIDLIFDECYYIRLQMDFVLANHISIQTATNHTRPTGKLKHLFLRQMIGLLLYKIKMG